jgi:hypothetical protein
MRRRCKIAVLEGSRVQIVSLVAGLTLAIIVFLAAGGWDSFGGRREAPSDGIVAPYPEDSAQAGIAPFARSSSIVFVVVLVSSEAEVAEAAARYASTAPGWHTEVLVLDGPDSEQDFQNNFNSLLRHGGPGSYRVVDLIRR